MTDRPGVLREFIDPLFGLLGWDIDNRAGAPESYKDIVHEVARVRDRRVESVTVPGREPPEQRASLGPAYAIRTVG